MNLSNMSDKSSKDLPEGTEIGEKISDITYLQQSVVIRNKEERPGQRVDAIIVGSSHETSADDNRSLAFKVKHIEQQSNRLDGGVTLWQPSGRRVVRANPMLPATSQGEMEASFD